MSPFPARRVAPEAPEEARDGGEEKEPDLAELRLAAEEFYRVNRVPELLERALNELFTRRPSDLHGHLADFFSALSAPPRISQVQGQEVLDSRGQPSIQAEVYCTIRNHQELVSSAAVASHFGPRDSQGKDRAEHVSNALRWIQDLNPQLQDLSPEDQSQVDHILSDFYSCRLHEASEAQSRADDSTSTSASNMADTPAPPTANKKGKKGSAVRPLPPPEPPEPVLPGSIAVGALSLSTARAGATNRRLPLHQHLSLLRGRQPLAPVAVPSVLVSVLSCGKSSPGKLNLFEEIILVPKPGLRTRQVVSMAVELQREVLRMVAAQSKAGASPVFLSPSGAPCLCAERPEQPLDLLSEACVNLGLSLGSELFLALSCAGPDLLDYSKGKYEVSSGLLKAPDEMVELLQALVLRYPSVVALIDPLRREDVEQWERLSAAVADSCSLLSDVTFRAQAPPPPGVRGHVIKLANHMTVSELIRISAEQEGSVLLGPSYSEPSSSEPALPDLAVGLGHALLRLGGLSGAERANDYNRLIQIEEELRSEGRLVFREKLPLIFPQKPDPEPGLDQDLSPDQEPSPAETGLNQD